MPFEFSTYDDEAVESNQDEGSKKALIRSVNAANKQSSLELFLYAEGLKRLPLRVCECFKLERLHLGHNQLSVLPDNLSQLRSLKYLGLGSNHFSYFPEPICWMPSLQVLYLNQNQLSDIPPSINGLSNLNELHLPQNVIHHLPAEIGELSNLQVLSLQFNQLSTLPSSITLLTSLMVLKIHCNPLDNDVINAESLGAQSVLAKLKDSLSMQHALSQGDDGIGPSSDAMAGLMSKVFNGDVLSTEEVMKRTLRCLEIEVSRRKKMEEELFRIKRELREEQREREILGSKLHHAQENSHATISSLRSQITYNQLQPYPPSDAQAPLRQSLKDDVSYHSPRKIEFPPPPYMTDEGVQAEPEVSNSIADQQSHGITGRDLSGLSPRKRRKAIMEEVAKAWSGVGLGTAFPTRPSAMPQAHTGLKLPSIPRHRAAGGAVSARSHHEDNSHYQRQNRQTHGVGRQHAVSFSPGTNGEGMHRYRAVAPANFGSDRVPQSAREARPLVAL